MIFLQFIFNSENANESRPSNRGGGWDAFANKWFDSAIGEMRIRNGEQS